MDSEDLALPFWSCSLERAEVKQVHCQRQVSGPQEAHGGCATVPPCGKPSLRPEDTGREEDGKRGGLSEPPAEPELRDGREPSQQTAAPGDPRLPSSSSAGAHSSCQHPGQG